MRTKVTLLLLFLNVALFFFIFHFERNWRTERVAMEVRRRVLGAEAADIRALDVAGVAPASSFRLERRSDTWFLTKPIEWAANPQAVSRMISDLQFLEHETSFSVRDVLKNGQSLAVYGLEHPKLTVTITSGGPDTTGAAPVTTTLRVGDATKTGERLYLLSPDGARIHVVGRELADSLSFPLDQLRADTVVNIPVYEARSLNLQSAPPAGVRVLIQRDGSRWWFETPIPARASKDAIDLAVNGLDSLRVKSFVSGRLPMPAPKDAPVLSATIEGNNRHETLFLGPEVPGAPAEAGIRLTYAQLEGLPAVFTVALPVPLFDALRNAQEALRDRHVLDFDPAAVTVITLQAPNQPELTLQRLEPGAARAGASAAKAPAAAAAAEGGWQIIQRGDAAQGPSTQPADSAAVQRLLDRLAMLEAAQFKSDAPQASDLENWGFKLPERTVGLVLAAPARGGARGVPNPPPAPSQMTLEIGRATARDPYVYARLSNPLSMSIYAVTPDILRETPLDPSAWRNRLLSSLPAAAAITALKLSDAATGAVIVNWKNGETAPDAVQTVLTQLRTLRAQRFLPEPFAPTVKIDGEDRPWKYRLDATIALPGGAGGGQTSHRTLWFAARTGGAEQIAGSEEFGAKFVIEQPLLDALWTLTYGSRDPGQPPPAAAPVP